MKRVLTFFLFLVLPICLMGIVLVLWTEHRWSVSGPTVDVVRVNIPRGAGVARISEILSEAGVIQGPWDRCVFLAGVRVKGLAGRLRAGEFDLPAGVSLEHAAAMLAEGLGLVRYFLTIPEGMTSAGVVALVTAMPELEGEIASIPPEGAFLPETYAFLKGDSREGALRRMAAAMTRAVESAWEGREEGLPLTSAAEAVILASIVEKETALPEERPRVAAVFINRLRQGMPLQSDPTVLYGLSLGTDSLGRLLRRKDLEVDHPWNTYTRSGLPQGPIANPGLDSLHAVLHPARTQELYFVADGSGGHVFATTLAEHNRNVAKWRAIQRRRAEEAGQKQ